MGRNINSERKRWFVLIRIDSKKPKSELIKSVARMLDIGELAILKTDTIYGICAKALSEAGVTRLFSAKMRQETKPVGVFVRTFQELKQHCFIDKKYYKFLDTIWPGPITCVLPRLKKSSLKITPTKEQPKTVAVRIPDNKIILSLIRELKAPLIQSSVNVTGQPRMQYSDIIKSYNRFADVMLDSGSEEHDEPSTVISLVSNQVKLLRKGSTSWDDIKTHSDMVHKF